MHHLSGFKLNTNCRYKTEYLVSFTEVIIAGSHHIKTA